MNMGTKRRSGGGRTQGTWGYPRSDLYLWDVLPVWTD